LANNLVSLLTGSNSTYIMQKRMKLLPCITERGISTREEGHLLSVSLT